jgi:hypothetical protein
MKKFIINSLLLLCLLLVVDRICGSLLNNFFYKQTHGDDAVSIELISKTKADVLMLGSSRASHHYITDSLEKHTGLSAYNGGRDNMGIHYIAAVLPIITQRYTPKCIILDIMPNSFLKGAQDTKKYLDIQSAAIMPFAKNYPSIFEQVSQYNATEKYKAQICSSYPYNSLIGGIFQNTYTNIGHKQIKGYEPLNDSIDVSNYTKPLMGEKNLANDIDTASVLLLEQCLKICQERNIKVVVVYSPFYFLRPAQPKMAEKLHSLCTLYNTQVIDYTTDTRFLNKPEYFYDELHLNHSGAMLLTQDVIKYIK